MNRFRRQQRIVLVGTMLLAGGAVFGQETPRANRFFGTLAFVGGTHYGGRVALDFKTKNDWLTGAVGCFFTGEARELPDDYALHYRKGFLSNGPPPLNDKGLFGAITIGKSVALKPRLAL